MLVSIIIPTKNRRELLRETLASVTAQAYENWEALVVDDGSDDGTAELLQSLAATEKRIRFIRRERPPPGAPTCRNIGVAAAKGEGIIFLDSDDLLAPWCLEERVRILKQNPKIDFVVCLTQLFHEKPGDNLHLWNTFTDENDIDRFIRHDQPWQTSGPLWRKSSLAQIGPWDETALSGQDWEFHIRALAEGLNYLKVSRVDSYWRTARPGSITSTWQTPDRAWNRIPLYEKVSLLFSAKGLWTSRRRRLMANEFYNHAFAYGLDFRSALRVWARGRRCGAIGNFAYVILLPGEMAGRTCLRMNFSILSRLFPERLLARTQQTAKFPEDGKEAPSVPPDNP